MSTCSDNVAPLSSALAIKLPAFWPHRAQVWFAQAEAQFKLLKVTSSLTKFYYAIAAFNDATAADLDDLLQPVGDFPYEHLKKQVLIRFATTPDERFQSLMDSQALTEQRPSQILREMRCKATDLIDPESPFFRQLFLRRLPPNIQLVLKTLRTATIDELAQTADELMPLNSSINIVTAGDASSEVQALRQEIADLREQLRALAVVSPSQNRARRTTTLNRSPSGRRRLSISPPPPTICYFHRKFGRDARRCRQPCHFQGNDYAGRSRR
uniref:Retrotransposon gag domain-containing protein n=1 Tax=Trichuris muris TaxID=70415 RepID=A0A5S6Q4F4_TRIMR